MTRPLTTLALGVALLCPLSSFGQEKNAKSDKANNTKKEKSDNNKSDIKSNNKLGTVDVSLSEGTTVAIPAGGELLEMTVAVPDAVRSGQKYVYRARLKNVSDNVTLTNVRLIQVDGKSVDVESSKPKAAKNSNSDSKSRTWNLGKLAPGKSRELMVNAVATKTGTVEHCFAVRYQETVCLAVNVTNPKVKIAKSGPEQVGVCELFEYRYELKNTGTGTAKDFVITDELPEGIMTESGKKSLQFRVEELGAGESQTYVASVHSMKAGDYSGRATVKQRNGETNQSESVTTTVVAPELNVDIAGPRMIKAGQGGDFEVTVKNTSETTALNSYLTLSSDGDAKFSSTGNGDAREGGKSYRYELGDIEAGKEKTVTVTLDSDSEGDIGLKANAVSYCARDEDEQKTVAKASSNLTSRVVKITSLRLSVVDTDDVIPAGDTVTYRVRVKNQGEYPDEDVQVKLALPEGMSYKSSDGPTDVKSKGQDVTLGAVDKLEAGDTVEWMITVNTSKGGEHIVEATLDSDGLENTVNAEEVTTTYNAGNKKSAE
ncbi:COG1361 S-layer family protein [Thalassoroseus pseudoceratinae]|uniref:COG1361 S-layer family protein n=1 Tax=Thalassoroseus pseudoceratinae TaxID=2713176 RepID=UPI00141EEE65|nr:DUF11 domain-containing protein [Thalassoroseus pseudoceratinae]